MSEPVASIERILADARMIAESGNGAEAVTVLRQALQAYPGDARLHYGLATGLRGLRQYSEAVGAYVAAIASDCNLAEPQYDLATLLIAGGHLAESIPFLRKTIEIKPKFAEAYLRLGVALQNTGNVVEGIDFCRQALQIDPADSTGHQVLGVMLISQQSYDLAEHHLKEAIRLSHCTDDADKFRLSALSHLATLYETLNRRADAIVAYDQMLAIKPDQVEIHERLARSLLSKGDFLRGWNEYEWRWKCEPLLSEQRAFGVAEWDGSSLVGRTILLHCEQGLGDTIQFCRYVPLLKDRGARVVLICQPPLRSLLTQLVGVDALIGNGDRVPPFDTHSPLLNVPGRYGTHSNAQIPAHVPYLEPPAARVEAWRAKLGTKKKRLRVGLVHAGNPAHPNDAARSIPLGMFGPFGALEKDIDFYNLQKEPAVRSAVKFPFAILNLAPALTDFVETAAALMNLDLLVTVDTAAAHLAGALGRPVWTLLPTAIDWRWQFDREDSPWYPTMRLFRQSAEGDWKGVIERVAEELKKLADSSSPDI